MTNTFNIDGYHGTSAENIESILRSGFVVRDHSDDWLGMGCYFFIDGLRDPESSARDWAISEAWNKKIRNLSTIQLVLLRLTSTFL